MDQARVSAALGVGHRYQRTLIEGPDTGAKGNPTVVMHDGLTPTTRPTTYVRKRHGRHSSEAESSGNEQADRRDGHDCRRGPADDLGDPPIRIVAHQATASGDQHDHD